jgi:eukaryotic-like serine/threonine-protein kinase
VAESSLSDLRIAPRPSTGSAGSTLPVDVVGAAAWRLAAFMYIVAGANTLYTVLYATIWRERNTLPATILSVAEIVGSLLLAHYVRRRAREQAAVTRLAIAYEIGICFALALVEFIAGPMSAAMAERISWVCVVIVLFPALVPARPRTTLAASVASAAMPPLAYAASLPITGAEILPAGVLLSLFMPPFVCAAISVFVAMVVHRLGTELARARRLGSYELVDRLGAGGMGEVWRARHRMLVRPAAIKLIRPEALGRADSESARELRERFRREAQATSLLTSPHTVELYDFGVSDDGVFYYVMELLDGIDLETLVGDHGAVPPERAVWLLRQVCESLDDAHRVGLVHRDIKPANIITARRGSHCDYVKVLDFGLVKGSVAGDRDVRQTSDARPKGTPAYMAPEAVTGEAPIDARSDLYSLGCVAYWLVTGQLVFDAASAMAMALAHVTETPQPPSARAPTPLPPELDRVILQCLARNPADRPTDALALQRLLDAVPFARPWSEARAAAWWSELSPATTARPRATDPARAPTLFQPADR